MSHKSLSQLTPTRGALLALSLIIASACSDADLADEQLNAQEVQQLLAARGERSKAAASMSSYDMVEGEGRATLLGLMYDVHVRESGEVVVKETDAVLPDGSPVTSWSYTLGKPLIRREAGSDTLALAERATLKLQGSRLSRDWGAAVEHYDHQHHALKHSLLLHAPPKGQGALLLSLPIQGDDAARHEITSRGVEVFDAAGKLRLIWSGLVVTDLDGNKLPASFVAARGALTMRVDVRGARFPILIDPIATNPSTTLEGDQIAANLGATIHGAGDVNNDGFDDLLVGQPNYTHTVKSGRALLFLGSATGIRNTASWSLITNVAGDRVGDALTGLGDVNGDGFDDFAVSAPLAESTAARPNEGIVWAYRGGNTVVNNQLSLTRVWSRAGGAAERRLGQRLSSAGDVNCDGKPDLLIAAFDLNNLASTGRIEVHSGLGTTAFFSGSFITRIGESQGFGSAIASAGNINGRVNANNGVKCDSIIVGDFSFDDGGPNTNNVGKIYIYAGTPTGMGTTPSTRKGTTPGQRLGRAVAGGADLNGDGLADVLITSQLADSSGRVDAHYGNVTTLISPTPAWTATGGVPETFFGLGLALLPDVNDDGRPDVAIGANNANGGAGQVSVFFNSPTGLPGIPSWTFSGASSSDRVGTTIVAAGDVNGDFGQDFVAAAASSSANMLNSAGRVFVFHGVPNPPDCNIGGVVFAAGAPNPNNPCEVCNPNQSLSAWSPNNGIACNDGNLCTTGDVCNAGTCAGAPVVCAPTADQCATRSCNPASGACVLTALPNGAACADTDGLDCTTGSCRSGQCKPTVTDGCLINNTCVPTLGASPTNDCLVCNPVRSRTRYTNAAGTTVCDDRNDCTGNGLCSTGVCVGAPPVNQGGACTDADICTEGTTCTNGVCTGGINVCM